jgi:hypothetical protein
MKINYITDKCVTITPFNQLDTMSKGLCEACNLECEAPDRDVWAKKMLTEVAYMFAPPPVNEYNEAYFNLCRQDDYRGLFEKMVNDKIDATMFKPEVK